MKKTLMRAGWVAVAALGLVTVLATRDGAEEAPERMAGPQDAAARCADDVCWIEAHRENAQGPCRRGLVERSPALDFDDGPARPFFDRGASAWPDGTGEILYTGDRAFGPDGVRLRYECLFTPAARTAEIVALDPLR